MMFFFFFNTFTEEEMKRLEEKYLETFLSPLYVCAD